MARGKVSEVGLRGVIAHKVFDVNLRNLEHDDYSRDTTRDTRSSRRTSN